jgi:hypothetical protein
MKVYKADNTVKAGTILYEETIEDLRLTILQPTIEDEIELKNAAIRANDRAFSSMLALVSIMARFNGEQMSDKQIAEKFDDEFIAYVVNKITEARAEAEKK